MVCLASLPGASVGASGAACASLVAALASAAASGDAFATLADASAAACVAAASTNHNGKHDYGAEGQRQLTELHGRDNLQNYRAETTYRITGRCT